jgi:hypothetical protein
VTIYGSKSEITAAEKALANVGMATRPCAEGAARLMLQVCIDAFKIKAALTFDGNTIWSKDRLIRDVKAIIRADMVGGMGNYLYEFLSLSCGSIAHYNKYGWIAEYPTVAALRAFFLKNEFGQRVFVYIPNWKTDALKIVLEIEQLFGIST